MDKQSVTYPYDRILFNHKMNEVLIYVATWMNLEYIMLIEEGRHKMSYFFILFI